MLEYTEMRNALVLCSILAVFHTSAARNEHGGPRAKREWVYQQPQIVDGYPSAPSFDDVAAFLKHTRVEVVKENILKELRMTGRPPKVNRTKIDIPLPVLEDFQKVKEYRYNEDDTTRAILRSNPIRYGPSSIICGFNWSSSMLKKKQLKHAKLSILKLANSKTDSDDIRVNAYTLHELATDETRSLQAPNIFGGWLTFDITSIIEKASKITLPPLERLMFILECRQCAAAGCPHCAAEDRLEISKDAGELPFIEMDVAYKKDKRKRRGVNDCDATSSGCCRRTFTVSFRDIDWHDWVIAPTEFNANYCHGSCAKEESYQNAHRSIMSSVNGKETNWFYSTCCVATRHKGIPLLYYDEDGILYRKRVRDMSVEECGCA